MSEVDERAEKLDRERNRRTVYQPPNELELPLEVLERFENAGMKHRWVRYLLQGKEDVSNVGRYLREGYEFVSARDAPEMVDSCLVENVRKEEEALTVGDLVLMIAPIELVESKRKHYQDMAAQQLEAVNSRLRGQDIQNRSKQSVTRGGPARNFASD